MLIHNDFEILYINMDKNVLKRVAMDQWLENLGFNYQRIPAQVFTNDEFVRRNIDPNFKDCRFNRNITVGEFGCFMSHLRCWQYAVDNGKTVLVLEDDTKSKLCIPDTAREVAWVHSVLNGSDYEFCYMGRQALEWFKEDGVEVFRNLVEPRYSWLAHAYMVTPEGAAKLIDVFQNHPVIPADEIIPYAIGRGCDPYVRREWPEIDPDRRLKALAHVDQFLLYQDRVEASETDESEEIFQHGIDPSKLMVKLVTCATDMNDPGFRTLFASLERHGWNLDHCFNIGHGVEWNGGDMIAPGGGQKVNLLKKEFEEGLFDDEDIIIFVDGYDVATIDHPYNIVRRWLDNFNPEAVLFAAERTCWPDPDMEPLFGDDGTPYRFLNSGCFIGKAKNVRRLIIDDLADSDDDQLYYQQQFFKPPEMWERDTYLAELDTECRIFQCLHKSEDDIEYDPVTNRIYNKITKTEPQIIHGNGYSKETLNALMSHVYYQSIVISGGSPPVFQRQV